MRKFRKLVLTVTLAIALAGAPSRLLGQTNFYEGKTIRLIVGLAAGGGYDVYARTIARHMGKHLPGNPAISVENMTGAGSLIATNYLYKAAKPDGLTMGHFIGGLYLQQLMGNSAVEFDGAKFGHIGVPIKDNFAIGVHKSTAITDVQSWIASKKVVKFGGIAPGTGSDDVPKILAATIGLPVQVVSGYKGTAETRLAFNNGEVAASANAWESTKSTWRKELDSGDLKIVLQATFKPHPELPNIPNAMNMVKTEEARKLLSTVLKVHGPTVRPFVVPPGTPKDRLQMLRKAFMDTMKDSEFLAECAKAKLTVEPDDGTELERNVFEILKLEASLLPKLKEILK
jgi:tripartite-type tricarboxylate transporter receptor subunit TctC